MVGLSSYIPLYPLCIPIVLPVWLVEVPYLGWEIYWRFHIYRGRVPASASCQRPSSISPTGPRWHRRWPQKTVHKTGIVAADNLWNRGTNQNNQDMGMRQGSTMWLNHIHMNDVNGWTSCLRWPHPSRGGTVVTSAKCRGVLRQTWEKIVLGFGRFLGVQ